MRLAAASSLQQLLQCVIVLMGACSKFVALSLRDVERFKRQKVKDLKDVFTSYAIMQIERCKKVRESTMTAAEATVFEILRVWPRRVV